MQKLILIIALIFITGQSCKEIYHPSLDIPAMSLVVDARITDEGGAYRVHLSTATPFNGSGSTPVQLARVHIEDNHGNTYNFYEAANEPGYYYSDPSKFTSHYGDIYTLIIQTKDGKAYRSTPQTLYPKGSIDSLTNVIKSNTLTTYYGEGAKLTSVKGVQFIGDINLANDASPYYRFAAALVIEYTSKDTSKYTSYCWMKYIPYQYLNLSDIRTNYSKSQQLLGFCPLDTPYYGIITTPIMKFDKGSGHTIQIGWLKKTLQLYMITFKQYHINSDVYHYYKAVNDQLQARQQIMDPITVQCIGNITCTTNTEEPVLGVFEVASTSQYSYYYYQSVSGPNVDVLKLNSIDFTGFSDGECQLINPPAFWLTK